MVQGETEELRSGALNEFRNTLMAQAEREKGREGEERERERKK